MGYRRGPRGLAAIAGDQGPWRLSPGTKGPSGYRQGPKGPAAIAGNQGAWRLSLGTKGPGGYRWGHWGLGLMGPWAPGVVTFFSVGAF